MDMKPEAMVIAIRGMIGKYGDDGSHHRQHKTK
jgi:hypothetical protein